MKKVLFLGQAPAKPASKHDIPGTYLHKWLHSISFTDEMIRENCHFYALTDVFPGSSRSGHLPPTKEMVAAHRPALQKVITSIQPDIIVPVGKMAISELLDRKIVSLEETIGSSFKINPFNALDHTVSCIPFSHPSGRSAWNHTHKDHVTQALELLKQSSLLDA